MAELMEVPDPDSEVPKAVRDEFFKKMKMKQSERVRARMWAHPNRSFVTPDSSQSSHTDL